MMKIDGVTPQNQTARPKTDLTIPCIEPAIIPLEATKPHIDLIVHTETHFCDLPNPNQTYQVAPILK